MIFVFFDIIKRKVVNMLKRFRRILTLNVLSLILFYGHLTFGFFVLVLIGIPLSFSNFDIAITWSVLFFIFGSFKFFTSTKPGELDGNI